MSRLCAILLSLCVCLAAPAAWAQDDGLSEEQQQRLVGLIEQGKSLYDSGDFEGSLDKFKQAYDIYAHPDIIYRIALCYERLGEDQQAVKYYRQFLRESPDAPERARVEKTIEVIESRIAKSEIRITTEPDGAVVYIDDPSNGAAGYTPTALAVKPGNYQLIVEKDGFKPVRELVTVKPGQQVQVKYQLKRVEASEDAAGGESKTGRRGPSVAFITLTSIGVASAVTAVVFFNLHSKNRQELERLDALPRQDVPRTTYERVQKRAQTNLIVAVSTTALSAVTLIWAYGVFMADADSAKSASGPTLGWSNGPMVGWSLPF